MISEMKVLIEPLIKDGLTITFPVRATYIKRSLEGLTSLLNLSSKFSLTSWEGYEGTNIEELQEVIKIIGVDRVYVDSRISKLITAGLN